MKSLFTILSIFLFFSTAYPQQYIEEVVQPKMEFNLSGGLSVPAAPSSFTDYWNPGFNAGIGFDVPIVSQFRLTANVDYNDFGLDDDALLRAAGASGSGVDISGGGATIFTVSVNGKLLFSNSTVSAVPYIAAGVGSFNVSVEDATVKQGNYRSTLKGESESALSALFTFGVNIPFQEENKSAFIEAKYVNGFTDNNSTNYFVLKAGIRFLI